ncbi:capsule polysaccharide export system inner membrane protein [Alteromonas mediterranea]|uniref:Capsule biosynthesis protein n=1 Tax=Alteromonas mediterranea TaxID=314275 RepID=A0AAC9F6S1_9ALTE|nr:capsule polysaccharide export system inner membrane protein [Alteromonas mediterranea]AFV84462.1 putative capsule polysaccharide export system inner membrane protein [Alteromonas mediterranea DE1]AGP96469.1 capsule polysaccharide export system inner membrane protein [Alteromonas mediterranea UM7]AGQ00805.1 capsule polysaccharide export system inner membrane protein [Alteromonas mediterranea UM4b]AMJ77648.1 capsule biosynthesis protein [Alteromonas mediterranea]AMJ81793.1 capsule biosynthesi
MEKSLTQLNALLSKNKALILVLPWVLYALYLVLWAAPQYESHSQLIVKSSDGGSSFDPSSLLMAAGVSGASGGTESQLVEAYIQSADMIKYLDETIGLREHYMSDKADMFSGLSSSHKQEDFYKFYLDHIEVSVDSASSVISLRTRAFDAEYAKIINQAIVDKAEEFINNINNDLAKSKLTFAKGEHEIVEQKLQQAKTEILSFQSKYNVLDPSAEGAAFQQIAFSLQATLAQKKAELSTMSTMMSNVAPEVINIKREIAALQKEVEKQKERISTAEGESEALSVSELMAQYSNLQVQLQLAIQAYSSSLITLENARVEAYQKLQHLVTVESPTLPDDNAYPTVIYNLVLFGVSLLLIYGIVRIVVATIREL